MRWWIKSKEVEEEERVVVAVVGGEKRTGEEEEQRILLETGGLILSSKMEDLFPHTMADMFRSLLLYSLSLFSISHPFSLIHRLFSFFHLNPPQIYYCTILFPPICKDKKSLEKVKEMVIILTYSLEIREREKESFSFSSFLDENIDSK